MKPFILPLLLALVTLAMCGCSQYDEDSMAGDAVDIPDPTPFSQQTPLLTAPSPSPAPAAANAQQEPGR
jgi:hypothetical protein